MRDSGWDQLPPDVGSRIYLNQPLTEKPSCEAGHMTAPDQCCINAKKLLPIGRASTHGPQRSFRGQRKLLPWTRSGALTSREGRKGTMTKEIAAFRKQFT